MLTDYLSTEPFWQYSQVRLIERTEHQAMINKYPHFNVT